MGLLAPPCPQFNVGHTGCTRRPSKKQPFLQQGSAIIIYFNIELVGARGAAIIFADVDVADFLTNPDYVMQTKRKGLDTSRGSGDKPRVSCFVAMAGCSGIME